MIDADKTKDQLIAELNALRQQVAALQAAEDALRQIQDALRESEEKYRSIVEQSLVGFFLTDPEGIILEWNRACEAITGLSRDEALGQPLWEVSYRTTIDEQRSQWNVDEQRAVVLDFIRTGCLTDVEDNLRLYPIRRADGEIRFVETLSFLIESSRGKLMCGVLHDMTRQKQVEQQLQLSYFAIEHSADGVYWTNQGGQLIYANQAACKSLGYTTDELLSMTIMDVDPLLTSDTWEMSWTLLQNDGTRTFETLHRRKDGWVFPVEITTSFLRYEDKAYSCAFVRDITGRKASEQRELDLTLERERTQIISDFIMKASHEFRTPLTIIGSKLHLALKATDAARREQHLFSIQQQANNILRLVEDLMTMSRLDGNLNLEFTTMKFNSAIRDVCLEKAPAFIDKHVTLSLDFDDGLPALRIDQVELCVAFGNLLDNAYNYTHAGQSVTVRTYLSSDNEAIIEIADTGIGISDADLPHIFERFYRVDRSQSIPGFGLGLPIAQRIIELHSGHIDVESRPGQGSVFRIALPVA